MTSASAVEMKLSRRSLLAGSAAAAGAFTFGFSVPFADEAQAQGATPEINAIASIFLALSTVLIVAFFFINRRKPQA